jgi:ankyrin repeat protein
MKDKMPKKDIEKFRRYFMDTVKEGNVEDVKHFIEMGMDVNLKDKYGRTPLMHAILNNDIELVKLLLENGADVTISDPYGRSMLELAQENDWRISQLIEEKMKQLGIE